MTVLTFLTRFVPRIEAKIKRQTIRGERKRPISVVDDLSLRYWSGRPYMTLQVLILDTVCIGYTRIVITTDGITVADKPIPAGELDAFAVKDGFDDWSEMAAWFTMKRGLPFTGRLIRWVP